jgi:SAM-dependent methyltransferase
MKLKIQHALRALFRTFLAAVRRSRFGTAEFDDAVISIFTNDPRYQNKGWQTTDQLFSVTRRHLINNHNWIPGVKRTCDVAHKYYSSIKDFACLDNANILDLGCGVVNPYGVASIFSLNGANSVTCLDIADFDTIRVGEATFDLFSHAKLFPDEIAFETAKIDGVSSKLHNIDFRQLRAGALDCLRYLNIDHFVTDIRQAYNVLHKRQYSLIFSHTVLEHFHNTKQCIQSLAALSAPHAIHYHYIDFCDHRAYTRPDKFHYWSYLSESKNVVDPLINKIRPSQYRSLLEQCGFKILRWDLEFDTMPSRIVDHIHPDWQHLSEDDIAATCVNCVCTYSGSR